MAWCAAQIHRVFASPFLHHSLLHVALNMSAWISLAGNLERNMFGTLQFAWLVLLLVWLTGFLTVVIANVAGVRAVVRTRASNHSH